MKPENLAQWQEHLKALHGYINGTPQLLSLLYDMDLMPEQLERRTLDYKRMIILAEWFRAKEQKWVEEQTKNMKPSKDGTALIGGDWKEV